MRAPILSWDWKAERHRKIVSSETGSISSHQYWQHLRRVYSAGLSTKGVRLSRLQSLGAIHELLPPMTIPVNMRLVNDTTSACKENINGGYEQWRRHGGGGGAGQLASPTSDRTHREIDADPMIFPCRKKNWGLQDLLHVLHAPTLRRTFVGLTITQKEEVVEVVEEVNLVGPQWSCGAFWDLSVLALALPSMTFLFYFIFLFLFLDVNMGPLPQK